jgi:hypothetical protein
MANTFSLSVRKYSTCFCRFSNVSAIPLYEPIGAWFRPTAKYLIFSIRRYGDVPSFLKIL